MRNFLLGILIVIALTGSAYSAEAKILVAVFSRADENYGVGNISTGNTMILAQMIVEKTKADFFEIAPVKKYPANYDVCTDLAKREQNQKARPEILEDKDISEYDIIFLGYPIWWGDIPMCVYTFIEAHNWNGKIVIPFCTHEGSGAGRTASTLKNSLNGAEVRKVMAMRGTTAQNRKTEANKTVDSWLKSLNLGF